MKYTKRLYLIERYFEAYPEDLKRLAITNVLLAEQLRQGMPQGMPQQTKKLLLRQLRQKFANFPEAVKQKIEATANLEQLETWLTQVIMANSLAETELGSSIT